MTNNEELKRCPFCGGKPYLVEDTSYMNSIWNIGCNNYKCKMVVYLDDPTVKKKAISAWNWRVEK